MIPRIQQTTTKFFPRFEKFSALHFRKFVVLYIYKVVNHFGSQPYLEKIMNTTKKMTATTTLKRNAEQYMILFGIIMQFSPKVINQWNMQISDNDTLGLHIDMLGYNFYKDEQGNVTYFTLDNATPNQIITAIKRLIVELNKD